MKKIKLTQGKFAKVDDADYEELNRHHWQYVTNPSSKTGYAVRFDYTGMKNGKKTQKPVYMHRQLLVGVEANQKVVVKHLDGDGLNNRRQNLYVCDRPKSRHKGVYWMTYSWGALRPTDEPKKPIRVAGFKSEDEAAKAYAALELVADRMTRKDAAEFARAAAAA